MDRDADGQTDMTKAKSRFGEVYIKILNYSNKFIIKILLCCANMLFISLTENIA